MKIGIPKEVWRGERRVALLPSMVSLLTKEDHEVLVERGAGEGSLAGDFEYEQAGAHIMDHVSSLYQSVDLILKVQPPAFHPDLRRHESELLKEGSTYIGFLSPLSNLDTLKIFVKRSITSFSMEYIPRLARAQSMDALSSMSTVVGYKAVILAAEKLGKMFPLLMTAAGTVAPATVLVLGAGVAGLEAIATAKRLGAKVEAFDPRPTVEEQVKSLGAGFLEMEWAEDVEAAGGYAKEQSKEFIKRERETIGACLPRVDVVICTAQVFGKRAPLLISEEMVRLLRPGSVIVDLAAEQGGNCALTEAGLTVQKYGVSIIGAVNLAATVPIHASLMYSRNITNLVLNIYKKDQPFPDFDDEITRACCITRNGEIVNDMVKKTIEQGAGP
ncbi:MAG: Re/Si-specific NAD(P)(+) transhydrogenase subunit alpha [Candidatus Tectomicrobia bacterium]|uniref:proton-translocating NAD(P)(+) transhydrogenase n=1 Tax=Tectimicrobiota bacterium TaxID=2528274 RepID=A0A933GKQ7_UNCTE|nr:Re/Si-specific NAD(P)(+) transhydrogenase subunit alpha [Candidatus Tectomicrobia bacterium]